MNTATSIATVNRPIKPGMTENVRIGTRIEIASAEARPGSMGWICGETCVVEGWRGSAGVADETREEICEDISEEETVDDVAWE